MIQIPVYTISNRLLSTIRAIGEVCGKLKARQITDTAMAELLLEAHTLSAYASAAIAGHSLSLSKVRRRLQGDHTSLSGIEREALNYHEIRQALFRTVRGGSFELNFNTLDWLLKRIQLGAGCQPFPDVEDGRARIAALMRFVNRQMGMIDPIVLAGIFHRQAILIAPDRNGSGKAIHLLTSALLGKAGLEIFELLSIEYYCQLDTGRYLNALGITRDERWLGSGTDFSEWLEYFAEGVLHELHRVIQSLPKQGLVRPVLEPHHQQIIDYVERHGSISPREYGVISSRGFHELTFDFDTLVRLGLIESKGQGQGIYYVLTQ
jgi:Fic family protein